MLDFLKQDKNILKANMLREANLYPFFRSIRDTAASVVTVDGKEQIMVGSNNYLGLTHHPYVKEAAYKAIEKYGTGCTGSRLLNGNLEIHEDLEEKLAKYIGHESAIVFSTGMQANLGAISCVCGPKDCVLSDCENHASIIDGLRLSLASKFKFKHNNMEHLEEVLESTVNKYKKTIIIADGVFSMTGEVIKLPKLIELAKKYNALVYIDDAHGLGVMGPAGKGTINYFDMVDDVHINMSTFSKSFASCGGFVSGSHDMINFIKHNARSFIFSASMPPAAVATVSACIDVVQDEPHLLETLWSNVALMKKGFKEIGFYIFDTQTPIIPIFMGDDMLAMQVTQFLSENGVFATPVISPAVKPSDALIRTSYMATHSHSDLQRVLEVFSLAKKTFNIPTTYQ